MAQLAYEAAAGHYERALQVFGLEERADVPRRCELLLALGEAQSRAGDALPARETFQRAAGLARKLDSPDLLARAALGYGAGLGGFEFGRVDQDLVGLLGDARRALGAGDSPLTARVLGRLAAELYFAREPGERAELSAEAVAMAERLGDRATLASALNARHLALWGPANADERLSIAGDIVALGQEVGDRELELRGHLWRTSDLVELGDLEGADGEAEVHAQLAEALRDPQHLWYARLFRAMRAMLEGRFEDAERLAGEALAVGRRTRSRNAEQMFAAQLFALRWLQGRLDEIEPELARLAREYPTWMVWRIGLAFTHADEGREAEARREFERLAGPGFDVIPVDGEWLVNLCMLSDACAFLGDAARAEDLLELLAPHADRNVGTGRVVACFGPVARYAGLMAGVLERWDEADAYLAQAIERDERMGARPLAARSRFDRAAVLLRRAAPGDAGAAEDLLDAAGAGASAMGMAGLERRIVALRGAGEEPPEPTPETASPTGPLLRWDGDFWTVAWRGEPFMVKDSRGLRHLAQLLGDPETEHHALELAQGAGVRAGSATKAAASDAGLEARADSGDAGALLDPEAKAAYRARLTGLREELDEAESFNDPERAARAREEMEFVTAELAGAVGLGGRDRKASSDAERARVSVTRAIRSAVEKLGANDPALGRHLDVTVKTGTFCSYQPEPGTPAWTVGEPS